MKTKKPSIFKNQTYNRLLGATVASKMGSYIGTTAFLFYLLKEFSDKPVLATLNELLSTLPILLVFFLIGVVADKFDRQKIIYYSDIISAILSVLLLVAVIYTSIFFMFLFIALRVIVHAFFSPSESALMQGILSEDEYMMASGVNQMVSSVMSLFGRGIGIGVFWAVGLTGAVIIDILSFVISAYLVYTCKIDKEVRLPNGEYKWSDLRLSTLLKEYGEGVRYIFTNKTLRTLLSGYFVFGMVASVYAIVPVYLLKYTLVPKSYEQMAIWEGILIGVGLLLGTFVITRYAARLKAKNMIAVGLMLMGLTTLALSLADNLPLFFVALFGTAFLLPAVSIGLGGVLPALVEKEKMGRVVGCINPLVILSESLMFVFIAVTFPTIFTAGALLAIVGVSMLFVAIYYLFALPRDLGRKTETA